ncbi:hypothetical protein SHIRM173S_02997 [Streptomyces hirsutus]
MDERFERRGVRLVLKRDDLDPSGADRKQVAQTRSNLSAATGRTVLTFGGAYSNHLRATAAAGRLLGLPTVGVVRGQELAGRPLNASLARCVADGMRLHFVDRATYRDKTAPATLAAVLREAGAVDAYVVPEGGGDASGQCASLRRSGSGRPGGRGRDGVRYRRNAGRGWPADSAGAGARWAFRCSRAASWPPGYGGCRPRRSVVRAATGAWTTASTSAATPGPPRNSTRSPRTSSAVTAYPSNVSMLAKLLYALVVLVEENAFPRGSTVAAVVTGRPFRERAGLWARASGCFPRCPRETPARMVRPSDVWVRQCGARLSPFGPADP